MSDEIHAGDCLIVDRSLELKHGDIVIASVGGELTVKRFVARANRLYLAAQNSHYTEIEITEAAEFVVWGVVTFSIHQCR